MEERTTDEIAAIFAAAGDSVTTIGVGKFEGETDAEWKDRVKRNVERDNQGLQKARRNNIYLDNRIFYCYRQSYC